ncbi:MAG: hypothetical protein AB1476_06275 [Candidatus Hadarchaeota archaeon]
MKTLYKIAAVVVVAIVAFAVSFIIFRSSFSLRNWYISADNTAKLTFLYSTDKTVTAKLLRLDNRVVDNLVLSPSDNMAAFQLAPAQMDPPAGVYIMNVEWLGRKIYEKYFEFTGPNLRSDNVPSISWGKDNENKSIIDNMSLTLTNAGDLPAYIRRFRGFIDGPQIWEENVGVWLNTGEKTFTWSWKSPGIQSGIHNFIITVENMDGILTFKNLYSNVP